MHTCMDRYSNITFYIHIHIRYKSPTTSTTHVGDTHMHGGMVLEPHTRGHLRYHVRTGGYKCTSLLAQYWQPFHQEEFFLYIRT